MKSRSVGWIVAALLCAPAAMAGDYRAPRTSTGVPDLNGFWSNATLTDLERPEGFKALVVSEKEAAGWEKEHRGKAPKDPEDTVGGNDSEWWELNVGLTRVRGQVRTSLLVAPADGKLPTSKAAKAARKARRELRKTNFDNPEGRSDDERCLSTDSVAPPMFPGGYNDNYQFVQTPGELAIFAEYNHNLRIVRIAAKGTTLSHPPLQVRLPLGDGIGHWEGQTLVIETTNFTAAEADPYKLKPGADMRVTERLTPIGPSEIAYAFRVEQSAVFDQSWMGEAIFHPANGPIYEFACHEGNYGMANMLAGARHEAAIGAATPSPPPPVSAKPAGQ